MNNKILMDVTQKISELLSAIPHDGISKVFVTAINEHYFAKLFLKYSVVCQGMITIAIISSFLIFIVSIMTDMYRALQSGSNHYLSIIIRTAAIAVLLMSYFVIWDDILNFTGNINKNLIIDSLDKQVALTNSIKELKEAEFQEKLNEEKSMWRKAGMIFVKTISDFYQKLKNDVWFVFSLVVDILIFVIFSFAMIVVDFIIVLLCFVGPMAIILLINPNTQSYFYNWFLNVIYILFWPLIAGSLLLFREIMTSAVYLGNGIEIPYAIFFDLIVCIGLLFSFSFLPSMFKGVLNGGQIVGAMAMGAFKMATVGLGGTGATGAEAMETSNAMSGATGGNSSFLQETPAQRLYDDSGPLQLNYNKPPELTNSNVVYLTDRKKGGPIINEGTEQNLMAAEEPNNYDPDGPVSRYNPNNDIGPIIDITPAKKEN